MAALLVFVPQQGTYACEQGTYACEQGTYACEQGTYACEQGTYACEQGTYACEQGTYACEQRPCPPCSPICMLAAPEQCLYQVRSTPYTEEACARGTCRLASSLCHCTVIDAILKTRLAGVFATKQIQQGTLVEAAHCIKLSAHEYQNHGR